MIRRQQHPGLDVDQGGGHHQPLPRNIDVQILHDLEVLQVLLRDVGNGNVPDIDLFLLDHVKQEIERPSNASRRIVIPEVLG